MGRQELGKGTDILIKLLPMLIKNYSKIELDVVGDGGALKYFKKLAHEVRVSEYISFHGYLDHHDVIKALHNADIFCFPTDSEGFPKVVLEALASGLPVITTKVSVLPELIKGCGVIVKENSPEQFADAVSEVVFDKKLYTQFSKKAVETAKNYSLEHWGEKIGEMLENSWGKLKS